MCAGERHTSLCEAFLCGRKVSGACCERHTGSQHIISLSSEPLLTLLAFSEPPTPTKGFFMMPFKPGLSSFGKWALISAKEAFLFSRLKAKLTVDFFFSLFPSSLKNWLNYVIAKISTKIAFEVHKCVNCNQALLYSSHQSCCVLVVTPQHK